MSTRLQITGIRKQFGATLALRSVSLELKAGQVQAIIGENGAGKSTLMKILSGACEPDGGTILLDGVPFQPRDPQHARRAGVAMIYQELNLAPHLSVEENIVLGQEPARWGWVDARRRRELAVQALRELQHEHLPLDLPVNRCTIAEQQLVEIARALLHEPKVLILDEPTSSLTQVDSERLFRVIQRLRDRGVSILYISHFLEECQRISDTYTVLRDGESVGSGSMATSSLTEIIRLMVGRDVTEIYPRSERTLGEPVFELHNLAGLSKPKAASLSLRRGEILGIAGLVGAGRTEMLRAAFGLDAIESGKVKVFGRDSTRGTPSDRWNRGVGLVSENRKEEGLLLQRSLADNLTLSRFSAVAQHGLVRRGKQGQQAQELMTRLRVRARDPWQAVGELSGGNQQKISIGRLLHHEAEIFLLDEPTRGIDVGSKAEIYRLINELAGQGKAVLFVSSYLPELMGVCDTIAVMCRGILGEKRPVSQWTEHAIIEAAVGKG
ncbi:MAG: sugar ABC transporter ATP-binding protein [Verrucomicrobiales bacterium]|nr:sugar ABC transporter ATP-binding protein [Verrucomicrobiales bacterium]